MTEAYAFCVPVEQILFSELTAAGVFSSAGTIMRVKLRGGGDEAFELRFAPGDAPLARTIHEQLMSLVQSMEAASRRANPALYRTLFAGWLEKEQPRGLLWQKRWFVLKPLTLRYYGHQHHEQAGVHHSSQQEGDAAQQPPKPNNPKGEVSIADIRAIAMRPSNKTEFGVALLEDSGRRPYILRAASQTEAQKWLQEINQAVQAHRRRVRQLPTLSAVEQANHEAVVAAGEDGL